MPVQLMLDGMMKDAQFAKDRAIMHALTANPLPPGIPIVQI